MNEPKPTEPTESAVRSSDLLADLKAETDRLREEMDEAYRAADYELDRAVKLEEEYAEVRQKWIDECERLVG